MCDPSSTENSLGFWLWYSTAGLQFQWRNQQDIWEGKVSLIVSLGDVQRVLEFSSAIWDLNNWQEFNKWKKVIAEIFFEDLLGFI